MDFTTNGATESLQWVLGQGTPTPPAAFWVKLHIGDPGADATANPAANTERQQITWNTISSPGTASGGSADADNSNNLEWTAVAATETYSHISIWDASTGGAAWYKGAMLVPVGVLAGGTFQFLIGNAFAGHE